MEKGRYRFSVTAEAYGLTNSGISRSLASRPPYRTAREAPKPPGRLLLSLPVSFERWVEEELDVPVHAGSTGRGGPCGVGHRRRLSPIVGPSTYRPGARGLPPLYRPRVEWAGARPLCGTGTG